MNKILPFFVLSLFINITHAQTKALTESGKEVLLFEDGTWKYKDSINNVDRVSDTLVLNKNFFAKKANQTFLLKSNVLNVGIHLNPSEWLFVPKKSDEDNSEYTFSTKNKEGFAFMVTEKTSLDYENLREIVLLNAQLASSDAKELQSEYRIVNNKKILFLIFKATVKGIKFTYMGYYYSNKNGTVQLVTYCLQQSFKDMEKRFEEFLNGLVEI